MYFMLKALLVEIFAFFLDFLVMQRNGFIKELRFISKFITSQAGQQIFTIHILFNILRRIGNQSIKFGQLIEHDKRNIFIEKSYTN